MGISGKGPDSGKKRPRLSEILFDVRPEESESVTYFGQGAAWANVFSAILVIICIWSSDQAQVFSSWLAISTLLFIFVFFRSVRANKEIPEVVTRTDVWETIFYTVLTALPWPILGYLTLGHSDLVVSMFVLLTCVGMAACGAIVMYRIPVAAISYVFTILAGLTIAIVLNSSKDLILLTAFMGIFSLLIVSTVFNAWQIARKREDGLKKAWGKNKELQNANEEIRRLTLLDILTGLHNRKAFVDQLMQRIEDAECKDFAVFLMDLDRFKHINDSIGHGAGDELLKIVGKRLRNAVSKQDVIARFGGDEFALIISNGDRKDNAVRVADRILKKLNEPVRIEQALLHPNASIGISFYPAHSESAEELVSLADIALHQAKEKGRGRAEVYDEEMAASLVYADGIEKLLRSALDSGELEVHYQPKIDIRTEEIIGAEALLRCYDTSGEIISTEEVLDVAEERGLIPQISRYIFKCITSDILAWRSDELGPIPVSINVHAFDLKTPELLLSELNKMFMAGVKQNDILLEVTEGCFVGRGSDAASATLDMIDEMGVKLSLDDFGTGHAALSHLKRLPISELKVDREFIHGICSDHRDQAITVAALEITRCLKVNCVAEGIETSEQLEFLKKLNTEGMSIIGQGHYWARAMSNANFIQYVHSYREVTGQNKSANVSEEKSA